MGRLWGLIPFSNGQPSSSPRVGHPGLQVARAAGTNFSLAILVLLLLRNCVHEAQGGELPVNLLGEGRADALYPKSGTELPWLESPWAWCCLLLLLLTP